MTGSKEIARDGFVELIAAIDRLTHKRESAQDRLTCCINSVAGWYATFMLR
jgi:hypothetical protein